MTKKFSASGVLKNNILAMKEIYGKMLELSCWELPDLTNRLILSEEIRENNFQLPDIFREVCLKDETTLLKTLLTSMNLVSKAGKLSSKNGKKNLQDEIEALMTGKSYIPKKYDWEYSINRVFAYIRDNGKCVICGKKIDRNKFRSHHVNPHLDLKKLNKVENLISLHEVCHHCLHSNKDFSNLFRKKAWITIIKLREKF